MGKVYLLGDRDRIDTYKIGVTNGSIEKRIKKLQTGNSGEIYEVCHYETKTPFILENFLHRKYGLSNILNEWFVLTPEEVKNFSDTCDKMQEQIDALKDNEFFKKK